MDRRHIIAALANWRAKFGFAGAVGVTLWIFDTYPPASVFWRAIAYYGIVPAVWILAIIFWSPVWYFLRRGRAQTVTSFLTFAIGGGTIGSLLGVSVWLGLRSYTEPSEDGTAPFAVEVRSGCVSDSGPLTLFMVSYPSMFGPTVSPVFYLSYFQITNRQDISSMVTDVDVAAGKAASGPWEDLLPIPLTGTTLHMLGGRPSTAKRVALPHGTARLATPMKPEDMNQSMILSAEPVLESELRKSIPAHGVASGWAAFDSRSHRGLSPGAIYFQVRVRDSAGKNFLTVVELPRKSPEGSSMDINVGSLFASGQVENLRSFSFRYYSDPYPSPRSQ